MKKTKVVLALACAVLLAGASIMGTLAYLTSTPDAVVNTFTIGNNIEITLDEAKVDTNGKEITGQSAARVKANAYTLMPGYTYDKDPTVHVTANSSDSYVFVKVENGISAFEATTNTIASQIAAHGWTQLKVNNVDVAGVYYKTYTQSATATDLVVFENFVVADNANEVSGWTAATQKTITVTAYAIQSDSFTDAAAAWNASGWGNTDVVPGE